MAALKEEPLPIFGDGEQGADFVYIDDVVDACISAVRENAIGRTYEIGTGVVSTVNQVAKAIIELTGNKSVIEYLAMRTGEVKLTTVSNYAAAQKDLGWEAKFDLRAGLTETIPYYAKQLGIASPV